MPQNELVKNATELLSKSVRQILFDAIIEAIETEKVSDTLLDLNLITQEQSGEILAEGIFQSINKAFDDVFSLPNEGEKESDVEVCSRCGSELEDEDEDEETNPVY
jgi:hypothetical protein